MGNQLPTEIPPPKQLSTLYLQGEQELHSIGEWGRFWKTKGDNCAEKEQIGKSPSECQVMASPAEKEKL